MAEKLPDGTLVSKPLEDMFPFLPRDESRRTCSSRDDAKSRCVRGRTPVVARSPVRPNERRTAV